VIVADDAACDETRRQVARWAARTCPAPAVRYVPVAGCAHGPAAARNRGWRAAAGEIVAFTDDDCVPAPGWLRAGLEAFCDCRRRGPPRAPGAVGDQPAPAAQEHVQRAALQEAPGAVPAAHPAGAAVALLPHRGRAAHGGRRRAGRAAAAGVPGRRGVGRDDRALLRPAPGVDVARAAPRRRDGCHVRADPTAGALLAPPRRGQVPRALSLAWRRVAG